MKTSNQNTEIKLGKYANVLLDRWFKRTFGTNEHKRLTELLLQLLIPEHKIVSIDFGPQDYTNQFEEDKDIRVDVECTDQDGTRFMVEMQLSPQKHFYERAIFNSSFGIQQQIDYGYKSYDYKPVYFIGIMLFGLHENSDRVVFRYKLHEEETGELMSENLQYIFVELPNVVKSEDKAEDVLSRALYSLYNMHKMENVPDGWEKDEIIKLLFESAKISNFAPEKRKDYISVMRTQRDFENQLEYALEKGMEKGLEKGKEEGRKEVLTKVVNTLREKGVSEDIIASIIS